MIWADMFWREQRTDLASRMPKDVILVDWQYRTTGPSATTAQLAASGRELWGGSAVCKNFDLWLTQAPLGERIDNVLGWHRQREAGAVTGLIHTTWSRSASIQPIYGPWEGWLPAFIAAGDPKRWEGHALAAPMAALDRGMQPNSFEHLESAGEALAQVRMDDGLSQRAVQWWRLALAHRKACWDVVRNDARLRTLLRSAPYVGLDTHLLQRFAGSRQSIAEAITAWEQQARQFWQEAALSDMDEFMDSCAGALREQLERDAQMERAALENEAVS